MNHVYEEIDEHIQWLINFMNEEYPNNYELVIDNNSGTIRNTLQAQMFLRNDLRSPEGFRKATEKPMIETDELKLKAELKPCPFCKTRRAELLTLAEIELIDNPTEYQMSHYGVVCDYQSGGCGASTGWQYASEEDAIEAWNRRADNG